MTDAALSSSLSRQHAPQPTDQAEASASFRRRSLDAAHEQSLISHEQASSSFRPLLDGSATANNSSLRRRRSSRRRSDESGDGHSMTIGERTIPKEPPQQSSPTKPLFARYYNRHVQTLVSLALFSYMGEYLRWFTEELFGLACHKPNSVGWNAQDWAPCTTAPGTTDETGGAFFTDLPANLIGCFIMGLLVTGDGESIAVNLPVAMLPRDWSFQQWTVTHVGLRTGFCGALTTFASWNTQMVTMLVGGKATEIGTSQWVSALFGYVVGLFIALQAFVMGRDVAYMLGRWNNPHLAQEADATLDKKEIGVLVNRNLPDFERRFLHDILIGEQSIREGPADSLPSDTGEGPKGDDRNADQQLHLHQFGSDVYQSHYKDHIHHLNDWKESTQQNRTTAANYARELQEIEKDLLVHRIEPRQELLEVARDAGWKVDSLRNWTIGLDDHDRAVAEAGTDVDEIREGFWDASSIPSEASLNVLALLVCTGLLVWGAITFNGDDQPSKSYRAQFLSALLSPFGTFTRWYLSRLNGIIKTERWEWLPVGTLMANIIASVISALMAALAVDVVSNDQYLASAFIAAIKAGYAGSLSTVSTFAAETIGLFRALPRYWWGYYYSFGSLFLALLVGVATYAWSVA